MADEKRKKIIYNGSHGAVQQEVAPQMTVLCVRGETVLELPASQADELLSRRDGQNQEWILVKERIAKGGGKDAC